MLKCTLRVIGMYYKSRQDIIRQQKRRRACALGRDAFQDTRSVENIRILIRQITEDGTMYMQRLPEEIELYTANKKFELTFISKIA